MKQVAEIICVGTEILMGNIVNTNGAFLSQQCAAMGFTVYHESTVGDNEERLTECLNLALSRADVVLLSGGLGPTPDDLTKEVTAKVLGKKLVEDKQVKEQIAAYFLRTQAKKITNNNWKQAEIISGCTVLANDNGTAPGLIAEDKKGKAVILLPGPPDELIPLFMNQVRPYLAKRQPGVLFSKMVKIIGVGESMVATKLADLIESQENPTIATYAKIGEVDVRVTASAKTKEEAAKIVKPVMKKIKFRFGEAIFTMEEEDTIERVLVEELSRREYTIATAESCTGGLLSGRIVNVPGASKVFHEGVITYSNKAKSNLLGVKKSTLKEVGAVSEKTAGEMAKGVCKLTKSQVGLSITGVAGPDGGTKKKPVGLVYIGCAVKGKVTVEEYHFAGNRDKIRERAVKTALDLARRCILR